MLFMLLSENTRATLLISFSQLSASSASNPILFIPVSIAYWHLMGRFEEIRSSAYSSDNTACVMSYLVSKCHSPPEMRIQCPAISNENQLSHKDFVLSISPLVCYIVLAAICNNKQKEGFFHVQSSSKTAFTAGSAQFTGNLDHCH